MGCEGMTSLQLLGIQLACKIVPEPQDVQDEILTDSGHKTTTTVILEGRMSFWIGRARDFSKHLTTVWAVHAAQRLNTVWMFCGVTELVLVVAILIVVAVAYVLGTNVLQAIT